MKYEEKTKSKPKNIENITQEHVIKAINEIDKNGFDNKYKPTNWALQYENKFYPPKHILRLSNKFANGNEFYSEKFMGGEPTNNFLRKLGFEVINKQDSNVSNLENLRKVLINYAKSYGVYKKTTKLEQYESYYFKESLAFGFFKTYFDFKVNNIKNQDLNNELKQTEKVKNTTDGKLKFYFENATEYDINLAKAIIDEVIKNMNGGVLQKEDFNTNIEENIMTKKDIPLNQILYGPPGTGKTYNTAVEALKIVMPENDFNSLDLKNRSVVMDTYKDYVENEQIKFITFHQSYSYEEFVEGIKPVIKDGVENLKYEIMPGIFKQVCNCAQRGSFSKTFMKFKDLYKEGAELKTAYHNNPFFIDEYRENAIKIKDQNGLIYYKDLEMIYNDDFTCDFKSRKEIDEKYADIKDTNVLSEIYVILLKLREIRTANDTKYVLIIDEINRGNISKILGELITLLEKDKRIGNENELLVKLPYSQKDFGVPSNLYIIGTMNTSDRSIASVDIALRRRFKFIEMMPKNNLVNDYGIDFEKIFDLINKKISLLIDREHQIGHSYFMGSNDIEELKRVWFVSVIPLLNEYFFGEWDKLVEIIPTFIKNTESKDILTNKDLADDKLYEFKTETDFETKEDFEAAILTLNTSKE